jgi:hypothetical protein
MREAGRDADQGENHEGRQHHAAGRLQEDVALVFGRLLQIGVEGHGRDRMRQHNRDQHTDQAGSSEGDDEGSTRN